MTILSNGNVGIGTTTPTALLDVNGDVVVAGDLTAENLIVGSTNVVTELTSLDTLTATHTDDIAINTGNILTKQDTITISTDLESNSLTTLDLEVNGGVNIITKPHFDTIVFRRPNSGAQINLGEIQCWVDGVNILPPNTNDLIGYFAAWDGDRSYPSGDLGSRLDTGQVFKAYNNSFEIDFGAHSNSGSALIITNIPLTAVYTSTCFI